MTIANVRTVGRNGERVLYWLQVKLFAHLQRLGLDFYERERGGQVMTRLTSDVDAVRAFIQGSLGTVVVAALTFLGVLGVMVQISPPLTLAAVTLVPAFVIAVAIYRKVSTKAYDEARRPAEHRQRQLPGEHRGHPGGTGVRAREPQHRDLRRTGHAGCCRGVVRAQIHLAWFFSFTELAYEVAAAIVLGVGAGLVAAGELTVGGIIAFLLYVTMLFSPIQQFSQVVDGYQRAKVGMRRIGELLRTPTSTPLPADPVPVDKIAGEIEFDDVRFSVRHRSGRTTVGPARSRHSAASTCGSSRARPSRSSGRPAPESRRWSSWSRGSTTRPQEPSASTGRTYATSTSTHTGNGSVSSHRRRTSSTARSGT